MAKITKDEGKFNEWKLEMRLTAGKLLAMQRAMERYIPDSPVAADVFLELTHAMEQNKQLQTFIKG